MSRAAGIARGWIGTPYLHQASCRGAGCDCLGLITGVWREMGGTVPPIPPYSRDWSEPQGEERLWQALEALLPRRGSLHPVPGDVVLFRMRGGAVAKHLGLVSVGGNDPRFIHAMSGRAVVESRLTRPWARRVVALYALPDPQDMKG